MIVFAFDRDWTVGVNPHPRHEAVPLEWVRHLAHETLVLGHTHVQHAEVFDEGMVVNPGSVGQPRDGDPDTAYAVVDFDAMTVDLRRVSYDISEVQRRIADTSISSDNARRLADGR